MPMSIVLLLTPRGPLPPGHLGREAQAWFLNQVKRHDPALSQALHDSDELRPYTVSDLCALPDGADGQPVGYALRITAFTENLEEVLKKDLLPRLPDHLRLWYGKFQLIQALTSAEEHPWCDCASYGSIVQAANRIRANQLTLEFLTPTAFRSEGLDIPLPIPSHIFRGCWQKWNAFAPLPLQMDESLFAFVKDCVIVEALQNINTTQLIFARGKRGGAIGFTGTVGLTLHLSKKLKKKWQAEWDHQCAMLHTLALFSFYCGCGHHATIGLGQTYPSTLNGAG